MFTPVAHQIIALDDCKKFLASKERRGICVVSGAGGKSVIIGKLAEELASEKKRVLIVTHRKELLQQNIKKIKHDSVGLVSAGLKSYEYDEDIVLAGIQTIYNKQDLLGHIDVILIDETQRVSNNSEDNSMYWQLLSAYPHAKTIGFTALPHRLKDGSLKWGQVFHVTSYENLLLNGYVTPLSNKVPYKPDLSDVKKRAKDYIMEDYADKKLSGEFLGISCLNSYEVFKRNNLKKALVFAPTVKHAKLIAWALHEVGFKVWAKDGQTAIITGDMSKEDREDVLARHKSGEFNCLVNVDILTEGYDDPEIDLLIFFRPTMSLSLFQQMLYRGVRLIDPSIWGLKTKEERIEAIKNSAKPVCYALDYAGNFKQHGGLLDTSWQYLEGRVEPVRKTQGKVCLNCEELISISAKECPICGYAPTKEEMEKQWEEQFDDETDINEKKSPLKWYFVKDVTYEPNWISSKGNKMLRVTYHCGMYKKYDFVFDNKRLGWLKQRGYSGKGSIDWDNLKTPKKICINTRTQFKDIVKYEWY